MDWARFTNVFGPTRRAGAAAFSLPPLVLEIEPEFVTGARFEGGGRFARRLSRMGVREFGSRAFEPLPHRPNVTNRAEFDRVVREVVDSVGEGNSGVGLLVPDSVVRVALLSFETLPDRPAEVEALVRWRLRDLLPYAPEEARLAWQVIRREPDVVELLTMAARSSVLAEYELALEHFDGGPALTLPATAALLPLLPDDEGLGQLLVHVCSGWLTTVVVCGSRLRLWRSRDLGGMSGEDLAPEAAREAARVVASARDHIQVEIGKVWLCARPSASPELVEGLGRAVTQPVETLVPRADLAQHLVGGERALFERFGSTFAGLVLNAG